MHVSLRTALKLEPENLTYISLLAINKESSLDLKLARQLFEKLLTMTPSRTTAEINLAKINTWNTTSPRPNRYYLQYSYESRKIVKRC